MFCHCHTIPIIPILTYYLFLHYQFLAMAFSVIRSNRTLVRPFEHTPSHTLNLSFIDKLPVLRCNARTLHVFRHHPEAADIIRQALSKALVPYYPLAGRLKESEQCHQLQIECSGEGVWFVEASANCTLDAVSYFDDTASIPYEDLLPPDKAAERGGVEPLVQMQVTKFECGGYVMGLIFCHSICDGLGAAQFLTAVGELARGLDHLTITPVWCRDFFPTPPQEPNFSAMPKLPPPLPNYRLQHANIDISLDQIKHLKQQFHNLTGKICSSFEIVAASFWRLRTQAMNFDQNTEVKLVFFANCRHLLDPPLPKGFYGNCFFPVTITWSSDYLMQSSVHDVVGLIQESKAKLAAEFFKFRRGEYGEDPFAPPLDYTTLFVSEWGRLGFNQVDYGSGAPVHFVPIQGSSVIPVGIVGSLPLPKKGIRLMTWCAEKKHLAPFTDLMMKLT
ncbi:transferase family protein [Tripterygium wilfordii]|uniref:Transferase family protein n=1 Tax=Tripterygium wilfordii TaxID=458696 RepID=A0A7J7CHC0_TRIWF|nr:acyl transferase 5 [Tripterygium wilfordii]KAF5733431.1 transferase family protein [Tripterygium wilfordii]